MKKSLIITTVVIAILSLTVLAAYATGNIDLWQVGKPDGAVDPIDGSGEYPATGTFTESFDYYIGTDPDPINAPSMPGYIGPANVCNFAGDRPCTDTTANLYLHFDLACSYDAGELSLIYDRYGSESDNIYFDNTFIDTISATESGFRQFSFDLGDVPVGSHTLLIEYAGGGSGNGHYIDYLKLDSSKECPVEASVDIKPGSFPNSFNINGNGVVPVAILGSADFDVTEINVSTISFAGLDVRVKGNGDPQCSFKDVSGDFTSPEGAPDGYLDLVCQFVDDTSTWNPDNGTASITGELSDGTPFMGSDSINLTQ